MNTKINKPYKIPTRITKNLEDAKILLQEYSGDISENTVIHQYIYQSLILKNSHPEISKILKSIAITEMTHLFLLGETILLLGMAPIYGTIKENKIDYWSGKEVNTDTNLKEILEININAEKNTIKNYETSKTLINNPEITELLERIIEDEKLHLHIFKTLLETNFKNEKQEKINS